MKRALFENGSGLLNCWCPHSTYTYGLCSPSQELHVCEKSTYAYHILIRLRIKFTTFTYHFTAREIRLRIKYDTYTYHFDYLIVTLLGDTYTYRITTYTYSTYTYYVLRFYVNNFWFTTYAYYIVRRRIILYVDVSLLSHLLREHLGLTHARRRLIK